jgi:hypothetical protein
VVIKPTEIYCPKPEPLILKEKMKKENTDLQNIQVLIDNFRQIMIYSEELESTVKCFEDSAKEK